MKRKMLIVNADDFGMSEEISDGIITAHLEGIVTSTSLMVNMPDAKRAVRLAQQTPSLDVGMHLNMTEGHPVLPPEKVPTLVNNTGEFLSDKNSPVLLTSVGTFSGGRTGCPSVMFKCIPTSNEGVCCAKRTARFASGILTISDVLVTIPSKWAVIIPSEISSDIPKSSALTISIFFFMIFYPI